MYLIEWKDAITLAKRKDQKKPTNKIVQLCSDVHIYNGPVEK